MLIYLSLSILALLGLVCYAWFVEPSKLVVRKEKITLGAKGLSQPFNILFISDLHFGRFFSESQIEKKWRIIAQAHQTNPFQMVIFGGDYLDRSMRYLGRLEQFIDRFQAWQVPLLAVLGNHDLSYPHIDSKQLTKSLTKHGLRILSNQGLTWQLSEGQLVIIGIKDLESAPQYLGNARPQIRSKIYKERAQRLDWYGRFDSYGKGKPRILIGHNPDIAYLPGSVRPDLILSGHTHGGQVFLLDWLRLPFFWTLPRGSFRTFAGRRKINSAPLIVSRGLAGSLWSLRIGRKPEVIVVSIN